MKDKSLLLLMLIVTKSSGVTKKRGCTNGSYQHVYSDEYENYSPTPDFHAFKCICAIVSREGRDTATAFLTGFFL